MPSLLPMDSLLADIESFDSLRSTGTVTAIVGLLIRSRGPVAAIGDLVEVANGEGRSVLAQVVGFRDKEVLSMALEEIHGLRPGLPLVARSRNRLLGVGPGLLGRVLDGFGHPIDGFQPPRTEDHYSLQAPPTNPIDRKHITEPLVTGVRAIDGILTCGKGQRVGIFGGSGVGKSTLLGTLARRSEADVNVVALIGERNREVREFIDHDLGEEGLKRSVVVVATSDSPAPLRVHACFVALAIAEYFRDGGANVLMIMDSVTRFAMAQREIGLAAGEPPSQKGYTPSVFQLMPRIFERAGNFQSGSITGLFTVLVEGDDFNEPICDAARSILDGHIVLSRRLSDSGHYPAIDVLGSVSRLATKVSTPKHLQYAQKVREALAAYTRTEELLNLGLYVSGSNPELDAVVAQMPSIREFLRQDSSQISNMEETLSGLQEISGKLG
jgi:flagellum-specific ATP synthase